MSGVRLNIKSNFFTLNNKTMIFYLLFFYLLSESMATNCTNDSTSYNVSIKIMCLYQGNLNNDSDRSSITVDVKNIPCECDAIVYSSFHINKSSMIDVDEQLLKSVTDLNKPVIVELRRTEQYSGWSAILSENGYANETNMLCDFAKNHSIQGYDILFLEPLFPVYYVDRNVSKNIISYINQLKGLCPFLIIGAVIQPNLYYLKNKDIYNFEELNKVLTFFDVNAFDINDCHPMLYNGFTPITTSNTSDIHLYSLEEIVSNLKETEICFNKINIRIPLLIYDIKNKTYPSYSEMCKGKFDNSSMCVQTSQNYYEKGKFCSKQKFGMTIIGVEWDDYSNACNCTKAFNGFHNIYAGYTNCMVMKCLKFDVQSTVYPYK